MISRRSLFLAPLLIASVPTFGAPVRLSYKQSCEQLQKLELLDEGDFPPLPGGVPRHDDPEPLGVNFFKTGLEDIRLENLTLNRTFFGRSEFVNVSFKNTDLSQSNLCWNDFTNVDFTEATLDSSDMRSSIFKKVRFVRTSMAKVDLRRSTFESCDFAGADLRGAIALSRQRWELRLSAAQAQHVAWTGDEGQEPGGG